MSGATQPEKRQQRKREKSHLQREGRKERREILYECWLEEGKHMDGFSCQNQKLKWEGPFQMGLLLYIFTDVTQSTVPLCVVVHFWTVLSIFKYILYCMYVLVQYVHVQYNTLSPYSTWEGVERKTYKATKRDHMAKQEERGGRERERKKGPSIL